MMDDLQREILEEFADAQWWATPTFDTVASPCSQIIHRKGRGASRLTDEQRAASIERRRQYQHNWYATRHSRPVKVTAATKDALREERMMRMMRTGMNRPSEKVIEMAKKVVAAARERLPDEREGHTHHFSILASRPGSDPNAPLESYEIDGYITTGVYPDGRLGEIFIHIGKHGGEQAIYDGWATACSIALQQGATVDDLFRRWVGSAFEPAGTTTNKEISRCTSVLDYAASWILLRYGSPESQERIRERGAR